MAIGRNKVEQKVSLDGREYSAELQKLKTETRSQLGQISKETQTSSTAFRDYTSTVKKSAGGVLGSLKEIGKSFTKNLGRGAILGGVVAGASILQKELRSATVTAADLDRQFARLVSRFDLTDQKAKKLDSTFSKLSKDTGIAGGSIARATEELLEANQDIDEAIRSLEPIVQAAAIKGEDPAQVARLASDILKSRGQEVNVQNINELLESALVGTRGGAFRNIGEVLGAQQAFDPEALERIGITSRDFAALAGASTRIGQDTESSLAALNAVVQGLSTLEERGKIEGLLGVQGIVDELGKFDVEKFLESGKVFKERGESDEQFLLRSKAFGLTGKEAKGLLAILKDVDKFGEGIEKVKNDQKTLAQAFKESTDNLADELSKSRQKVSEGFRSIVAPFAGVGTSLLRGDFGEAFSKLPTAVGESIEGISENKAIVGGALGLTALTGIFGKKLGLFGGIAKGAIAEQITGKETIPVFVVNASEISSGLSSGSIADAISKKDRLLGKVGGGLGKAGLVAGAGAAGFGIGTLLNKFVIEKFTQGQTEEGFQGNVVERLFFKLDKLIGGESAEALQRAQKIIVELDVKDDSITARPKASDNPRDSRGF